MCSTHEGSYVRAFCPGGDKPVIISWDTLTEPRAASRTRHGVRCSNQAECPIAFPGGMATPPPCLICQASLALLSKNRASHTPASVRR